MKKYNLSKIMKRAWELVKKAGMTISSGLKKAWEEAKAAMQKIKFNSVAKVAIVEKGEVNPYCGTEYDSESNYYDFKLWQKGNYHRIYINDYKRRTVGYIDLDNGNALVSDFSKGPVVETAAWFLENYEF